MEKIKGVLGLVQCAFLMNDKTMNTKAPLRTSEMRSGFNSMVYTKGKVPQGTKKRYMLKSIGKKLKTYRIVLRIIKAVLENLRGVIPLPHIISFRSKSDMFYV